MTLLSTPNTPAATSTHTSTTAIPNDPSHLSAPNTASALKFITCGSVDDGKSTLIGRLLVDSRSVLQDQLANVSQSGQADLALFTDGLSAEREQGITIDVAYRYFATTARKFIIGDAPGHEQYTRNMVTAASSADAAVVLVDASKLAWQDPAPLQLLPQTRRHALLVNLLRVPHIIFAVNKLDALDLDAPSDAHNPSPTHATGNAALAFARISQALETFAHAAGIPIHATIPMSALKGYNVVQATPGWCGYAGPSLLRLLERLPSSASDTGLPFAFPVQWVEKFHASADTSQGRRTFWGRVACGNVQVGHSVRIFPSGQTATVAQVLDAVRSASSAVEAGHSAGLILDREVDVSRGDWLLAAPSEETPAPSSASSPAPSSASSSAPFEGQRNLRATVAWMDDEPLVPGRTYWALHGHRWIKAKVQRILNSLDINTLQASEAQQIPPNGIGHIELVLQEPIAALPYQRSRLLGSLILVDTASHKTSGALLLQ